MRRRMIKKCRYLIMRYCVKAEVVGRGGEVERWRGGEVEVVGSKLWT
jgi:hypothetical protein